MNKSQSRNSPSLHRLKKPLGEILVEAGLVSVHQIELALQEQKQHNLRLGEILANHGWIKQETADFFVLEWSRLLQEPQKQPLVYYFRESGLLTDEQIREIKTQQNRITSQKNKKIRFHQLAVKLNYLKPATVDFFLSNIFDIHNSSGFSFTKPYELLRQYTKGITNFKRTDLSKAPLMGISLKGVSLDGSNLKEVDLTGGNLSDSSLIQVNFTHANLSKAILTGANLERSCLIKANLHSAHLEKTNFQSANLKGADLTQAYLSGASFAGANLTYAKLSREYPYDVYYDRQTRFDSNFDPKLAGWKELKDEG